MLTELALPPGVEAERVVPAVMADLRSGKQWGVVVDSPPGAGKSILAVHAAVELAIASDPLMVLAEANEQVDDLIDLAQEAPAMRIGRRSAADYKRSDRLEARETVRLGAKVADPGGSAVIAGTAPKGATALKGSCPWAIVDRAIASGRAWGRDEREVGGRAAIGLHGRWREGE